MAEFQSNLFKGVDMTSEAQARWDNEEGPARFGFLDCLDKFEASFFNLTPRQAHQLDPQTRLLMETSFEAIVDSGTALFRREFRNLLASNGDHYQPEAE